MSEVLIFDAEKELGLEEVIKANASIAYCTQLEKFDTSNLALAKKVMGNGSFFAKASVEDLYPTKSILVTTNWNKNDDVFGRFPVWQARATPVNKPTNIEHDEKQLVGHMTETWAIDFDGNVIPDDTELTDLPPHFHLCNAAVLYTKWQDSALKERTTNLIASIEAGEMFVSMECLFSEFDYALIGPDNSHSIVERNQATAHLSQHLRAYGGDGVYDGYRLGRFLKSINFSAKGYVKKPANSNSIILSTASLKDWRDFHGAVEKNASLIKSGVLINNTEANEMSDILQKQLDEMKQSLASVQSENKVLQEKLAKADIQKYEVRIAELESQNAAFMKKDEEDKKKKEADKAKADELEAKVADLSKANEELKAEISRVEAEKLTAGRISSLVDGGIAKDKAEATVTKFVNLNDEQFETVASALIEAAKVAKATSEVVETEETVADDAAGEAAADSEVLETAQAGEDVEMNVETEQTSATEKTRQNLAKLLAKRLGVQQGE